MRAKQFQSCACTYASVCASSVPSKCVGSSVCLHVWVCNMSTAGLLTRSLPKEHFNFRSFFLFLIYPSILFRPSAASFSPHSLVLSPSLPLSITPGLMRLTSVSLLSYTQPTLVHANNQTQPTQVHTLLYVHIQTGTAGLTPGPHSSLPLFALSLCQEAPGRVLMTSVYSPHR